MLAKYFYAIEELEENTIAFLKERGLIDFFTYVVGIYKHRW